MATFIGVLAFLTNHTYNFRRQRYLQLKGGFIGVRGTACIAKARMALWSRKVKAILSVIVVNLFLLMLYIDDARFFLEAVTWGMSFNRSQNKIE